MTQKQIAKASDRLASLYEQIPEGAGLMEIVDEIVELEILLEQESNK